MKQIIYLLLMTLAINTNAQKSNLIEWSESRPLQFTDYKGKILDSTICATTQTEISLDVLVDKNTKRMTFRVHAYFHTEGSYFTQACYLTPRVLTHEQLHFDITEMVVRQLRRAISQYQGTLKRSDYDAVIKMFEYYKETWDLLQTHYDEDTDHGNIQSMQDAWQVKISNALIKYKAYGQ